MERQMWKHSPRLKVQSCNNGPEYTQRTGVGLSKIYGYDNRVEWQCFNVSTNSLILILFLVHEFSIYNSRLLAQITFNRHTST